MNSSYICVDNKSDFCFILHKNEYIETSYGMIIDNRPAPESAKKEESLLLKNLHDFEYIAIDL